jgi:NADPH-dependent 2,4-dienoyl-CoA reductase/sulfur reductase-like enzyme
LAKDGRRVTVIDMLDYLTLAADWPRGLSDLLEEHCVRFLSEVKLEEITGRGALVIDKIWSRFEIPVDTVILSLGLEPRTETVSLFKGLAPDVYTIGDCVKPQTIKEAVHGGFNVAVEI